MAVHGVYVMKNGAANLVSRNGRVNAVGGDNKLQPYEGKQGDVDAGQKAGGDHTSFKRDDNGNVYKYETYQGYQNSGGEMFWNPQKRFDGGAPNGAAGQGYVNKVTKESVPTPHVQGKTIPGGVRAPEPSELPRNIRFFP